MAVTIKDVAKLAGVSPSTVSRVCNNNPTISRETRERVQKAIQELGYELTISQDTQSSFVSKNIGVILPPSALDAYENTFYLKAIRGISQICNQRHANTGIVTGQYCNRYRISIAATGLTVLSFSTPVKMIL